MTLIFYSVPKVT